MVFYRKTKQMKTNFSTFLRKYKLFKKKKSVAIFVESRESVTYLRLPFFFFYHKKTRLTLYGPNYFFRRFSGHNLR